VAIDRLLIAGFGSIGARHLRLARSLLPHAQILVMRHRGDQQVPVGADGCVNTLEQALAFRPEAAVIAGPSTMHAALALPLAKAGAHLLIEKPIDASSEQIPQLLNACDENRCLLLVGYNLRFLPSLRAFRDAVHRGQAGRILSVRAEVGQYLPSWRPAIDYRDSVSASRKLGGGVLLELSHEIDYLRWIFGELVWVKAAAARQSALEIDVEDCAHLVFGFRPDDAHHQLMVRLDLDFIRHDTSRSCVAIGDAGSLRWNGLTGVVDFFAASDSTWQTIASLPNNGDESYLAQWRHFLACIAGEEAPLTSGIDGLRALQAVEAARQSASQVGVALIKDLA
jgi:predicted dehydrogenase